MKLYCSSCGRGVSISVGILGAVCTALLVAAITKKIELSSNEKYVLDATTDIHLTSDLKYHAADIIQAAWLKHKHKRLGKSDIVRHQHKRLHRGIKHLRETKADKLDLSANAITLLDVSKDVIKIKATVKKMEYNFSKLESLLADIDQRTKAIYGSVTDSQDTAL